MTAQLVDQAPPVHVLPARQGIRLADMEAEQVPKAVLGYDDVRPGLSTVVPDGAYQGTTSWQSPDIFLKGMRTGLKAHPEMRRIDAKDLMGLEKCMRILEAEVSKADHGTGRNMRELVADIAKAAQCSIEDVRRFHRIASRRMQIMVPIAQGRLLTIFERLDVWGRQISPRLKQHGVTQVWAFHVPDWLRPFMAAAAINPPPVDNSGGRHVPNGGSATHPRSGDVLEPNHLPYTSPSEPTSSKSASLRSPSGPGSARTAPNKKRRPPPGRELAVKLVQAMPLLRSTSPKRLQHALKRFAESRPVWLPEDFQNAFQTVSERTGRSVSPPANQIHTPWAFFVSFLQELHEHDDHPRLATVDPTELRCSRTECDHGWIVDADCHVQELLGLQSNRDPLRRCDQCRPGAWPESEPTVEDLLNGAPGDDTESPF